MFGFVSAARLLAQPLGRLAKSGAPKQGRGPDVGRRCADRGHRGAGGRKARARAPGRHAGAKPARASPPSVRLQMAPQVIEKAQNAPGIGARSATLPGDEPAPSPAFADALG